MSSTLSTTLRQHRPALVLAVIAAVGSIYLIYTTQSENEATGLHRSNAVRRSRRASFSDQRAQVRPSDGPSDDILGDDALTEASFHAEDTAEEGQALRELAFAISKNRARTEGIVHRGVTCDKCGTNPIAGVRYRCSNCQDFDLCESCEARDEHPPTHVFYKIKVPAHWAAKLPLPLWYPGRPTLMPAELDQKHRLQLHKETGYTENQIDGLYQQFRCIAGVQMDRTSDPLELGIAIDRAAFDQCFIPETRTKAFKRASLILDRLFKFYDRNGDGLIDFEEFVLGIVVSRDHTRETAEKRTRRIFEALDLDDDGRVTRRDCLKFFRAFFELNREFTMLLLDGEALAAANVNHDTHETITDAVSAGRPLASFFTDGWLDFDDNPAAHAGKTRDAFGDLVPVNPSPATFIPAINLLTADEITTETWHDPEEYLMRDLRRLLVEQLAMQYADESLFLVQGAPAADPQPPSEHEHVFIDADAVLWVKIAQHATPWSGLPPESIYPPAGRSVAYIKAAAGAASSAPHRELLDQAKAVALAGIRERLRALQPERLAAREEYGEFYLDVAESVGDERPAARRFDTTTASNTLENDDGADDDDEYYPIGGSAVAQNIYAVTQQAINDVLDPMFRPAETRALQRRQRRRDGGGGGGAGELEVEEGINDDGPNIDDGNDDDNDDDDDDDGRANDDHNDGSIGFEDFMLAYKASEGHGGGKMLEWVGSWLDLVRF